MAGVSRIQRDAAAMPEVPPHAWPLCPAELLAETLTAEPGPALVEFWAADVLFGRLLAPLRISVPESHGTRLRLLCCKMTGDIGAAARFGAAGLPALVLFKGGRRVRHWLGATDLHLLHHDLDVVLGQRT